MTPHFARNAPLQRAFTSFPSGSAGAALLLLRVVVGMAAMTEAVLSIATHPSPLRCALAIPAAFAGLALLPGLAVPFASMLLAAEGIGIFIFSQAGALVLLGSRMALLEFIVMAVTLAMLGPGAASIDARLFGRREVEID